MNTFRYLGITFTENLSHHTSPPWFKKAQKRLQFLQKCRTLTFQSKILVNVCRGAIESILPGNITNWHGSA